MISILKKITNWFNEPNIKKCDSIAKMDIADISYIQLIEYDFEQITENEDINCVYVSASSGGIEFYYQIGYIDWNTKIVTLKADMVGSTDRSDVSFKFNSFDHDEFYRQTIEIFINRV